MATSQTQKLSREDFLRQKVIDEKRKAGTLPAEVDPETGKELNPHIPHYLAQAPWYLDINHPTLKHQKARTLPSSRLDSWYEKGINELAKPVKYRKGACVNCGSMTHSAKDCVERPRKVGAKWTGKDLMPDENVTKLDLDYEAKRDRWNGYDPSEHSKLMEEWELIEKESTKVRERKIGEREKCLAEKEAALSNKRNEKSSDLEGPALKKLALDNGSKDIIANESDSDDDNDDDDKYAEGADMPGQKLDTKTRTTVRNLRIREDTAKYLLNLDVDSSYYDPKTRSMRENPNKKKENVEDQLYKGDNFLRWTGDAPKQAEIQEFAWEAESWSNRIHVQANPTESTLIHEEYQKKKSEYTKKMKEAILERYGGAEYMNTIPKELLIAQTDICLEYSQDGRIIESGKRILARSRYIEDLHPLNHTSIWGSWWCDSKWGYACCHSTDINSFCNVLPEKLLKNS